MSGDRARQLLLRDLRNPKVVQVQCFFVFLQRYNVFYGYNVFLFFYRGTMFFLFFLQRYNVFYGYNVFSVFFTEVQCFFTGTMFFWYTFLFSHNIFFTGTIFFVQVQFVYRYNFFQAQFFLGKLF